MKFQIAELNNEKLNFIGQCISNIENWTCIKDDPGYQATILLIKKELCSLDDELSEKTKGQGIRQGKGKGKGKGQGIRQGKGKGQGKG